MYNIYFFLKFVCCSLYSDVLSRPKNHCLCDLCFSFTCLGPDVAIVPISLGGREFLISDSPVLPQRRVQECYNVAQHTGNTTRLDLNKKQW